MAGCLLHLQFYCIKKISESFAKIFKTKVKKCIFHEKIFKNYFNSQIVKRINSFQKFFKEYFHYKCFFH